MTDTQHEDYKASIVPFLNRNVCYKTACTYTDALVRETQRSWVRSATELTAEIQSAFDINYVICVCEIIDRSLHTIMRGVGIICINPLPEFWSLCINTNTGEHVGQY